MQNLLNNLTKDESRKVESTYDNNANTTTALEVIDERRIFDKDFRIWGTVENPLFLAKDVAVWIDYAKTGQGYYDVSNMLSTVDDDEKVLRKIIVDGKSKEYWLLTEDGLYEVLMQSKKPIAKQFKKKVKEILKTIRKTGGYINNSDMLVNTYFDDIGEEQKIIIRGLFQSIENKQKKIATLNTENDLLAQKALQWADRPLINALVRAYGYSIGGDYSKAWTGFKKELLYRHSINLNARITHYLNETGKKTKPKTLDMIDDSELLKALSTATALCRENNVDISDIINSKAG